VGFIPALARQRVDYLGHYVNPTDEAVKTGDGKARDEHFGSEPELIGQ
jgi:hypothetical protein